MHLSVLHVPTYLSAAAVCGWDLSAGLRVHLTFRLSDDVADSQPLAHIMEGLIPRITPLINVII